MHKDPENDPVWDLLGNASKQEASEMFSRDVMRSIRLDAQEPVSWWQKLLRPAPIVGSLTAVAACVVLTFLSQTQPVEDSQSVASAEPTITEESLDAVADILDFEDELDELISPMALLASNDIDLQEFEVFLEY